MSQILKNSPSNIKTGWRQKFFFHVERDGILDFFIETFKKNGDVWIIKKDVINQAIDKTDYRSWNVFSQIYEETLNIDGDYIYLSQHVVEHLLKFNWRFSLRNFFKMFRRKNLEIIWPYK